MALDLENDGDLDLVFVNAAKIVRNFFNPNGSMPRPARPVPMRRAEIPLSKLRLQISVLECLHNNSWHQTLKGMEPVYRSNLV